MADTSASTAITARWRVLITGVVQGVGFRPFVYRLAYALQLTGWVRNDSQGVEIEIQGAALAEFLNRLSAELPPLASISHVSYEAIPIQPTENHFQILPSTSGQGHTRIASDKAICKYCLEELFDSHSRFYQYPFINCSDCGSRYAFTEKLPYDRCQTTLRDFTACSACLADYRQPTHRRYHTEAITCADCGPQYTLRISDMAKLLREGKILAIKGIGGYQLICDANQPEAVQKLRERKRRAAKPFAVMVLNTVSAASMVSMNSAVTDLLLSPARPIVLLPKKSSSLEHIAPKLGTLGVMLPSTAIHYLLLNCLLNNPTGNEWLTQYCPITLVITSGNISGEPLIKDDFEATEKLQSIADVVIGHSLRIFTHVDDSVLAFNNRQPFFIRRARGFVPEPIELSEELPPILGLGGHLKNTFCITRDKEAFVSQHIGDLNNAASIRAYQDSLVHLLKLLGVTPDYVVHDLHPNYYTTQIAGQFAVPHYSVQHHQAHMASVAAEHHCSELALGLILDGFGLGDNQQSWGGELFLYQNQNYRRLASLRPLAQPGGDRAASEPWRMAVSALYALGLEAEIPHRYSNIKYNQALLELLKRQTHCPPTSSCGRLFDAASALLGVCLFNHYEAQAAMQLEALVNDPQILEGGWVINDVDNQLDLLPTLRHLLTCDPIRGANVFHGTLAAALADWVITYAKKYTVKTVLLGGGCFLNGVLVNLLLPQLIMAGLNPLLPKQLPPNDGGISLGQAWLGGFFSKAIQRQALNLNSKLPVFSAAQSSWTYQNG